MYSVEIWYGDMDRCVNWNVVPTLEVAQEIVDHLNTNPEIYLGHEEWGPNYMEFCQAEFNPLKIYDSLQEFKEALPKKW